LSETHFLETKFFPDFCLTLPTFSYCDERRDVDFSNFHMKVNFHRILFYFLLQLLV
jgi:hypothetical protein